MEHYLIYCIKPKSPRRYKRAGYTAVLLSYVQCIDCAIRGHIWIVHPNSVLSKDSCLNLDGILGEVKTRQCGVHETGLSGAATLVGDLPSAIQSVSDTSKVCVDVLSPVHHPGL